VIQQDLEITIEQLAATLQSAADGVIVTDIQGRIEFLNSTAECLTGIWNNAAQGRPLHEVLRLEEAGGAVIDNLVELALISESSVAFGNDVLLASPSGGSNHRGGAKRIDGEISVRTNSGSATGTVVTFRDNTIRDWEEQQRREEQKTRAIGQLAGSVAHQLNNSLTIVLGHCELLLRESNPGSVRTRAAAIQKAGNSIAALSRQLFALSRKDLLQPLAINLNHLLERSRAKLKSLIPAKIELTLSLESTLGMILVDPSQIEQAVTELVRYCAGRMPEGGRLEIATANITVDERHRARHLKRYVRLTIQDSGPRLNAEATEELFQPLWNKELGKPSGLGLFTVRNMISAARGHLSVESESAGAKFVLLFPHVEAEIATPSKFEQAATLEGQPTVLLVEDDDAIRILLNNSLEKQGYRVIEARDGSEALLQAEFYEEPIHLLITDSTMPNMDGPTLARKIAISRPDTKVLLISGSPEEDVRPEGAHFLSKPFSQRELLACVERIL
jgi:nitrogen-specific signal transduction histidine kinase/CheY-like chemotaxis protein